MNTFDSLFDNKVAELPCGCMFGAANDPELYKKETIKNVIQDMRALIGSDISEDEWVLMKVADYNRDHFCEKKPVTPADSLPSCLSCGKKNDLGIRCQQCSDAAGQENAEKLALEPKVAAQVAGKVEF